MQDIFIRSLSLTGNCMQSEGELILHIFVRNICQPRVKNSYGTFCDSIEEYDPQADEWREVGEINIK